MHIWDAIPLRIPSTLNALGFQKGYMKMSLFHFAIISDAPLCTSY